MAIETAEDLAAMFADDEFAESALWRVGGAGAGVAVSVVRTRLPELLELGQTRLRQKRSAFLVRASEAPGIALDDTLSLGAETFSVRDVAPDASGAVFTLDCAAI